MWCTVTLRGTFHSGAMVNDVTRLFKVGVGPVRPPNDNALAEPHLAPAHYLQGVGRQVYQQVFAFGNGCLALLIQRQGHLLGALVNG